MFELVAPAIYNAADSFERVAERADQSDPLVMYFAADKRLPLTIAEAMSLAGAATVLCAKRWRGDPRHADAFAEWLRSSFRKVVLRCTASQLERIIASEDCAVVSSAAGGRSSDPGLACLPPVRRSAAPKLLRGLRAYTEAPRGNEPPPAVPAADSSGSRGLLTYVIRPAVMKSHGKAMAQAGHAALMAYDLLSPDYASELERWIESGARGRLLVADDRQWEDLKRGCDCVCVRDAGLTQLASGTETVIALPPGADPTGLLSQLDRA